MNRKSIADLRLSSVELSTYRNIYRTTRKNALTRGISFDLTLDEYHHLIVAADGRCMVTRIPFEFVLANGKKRAWCPSIDRINSDKGYTNDNCRLVCVAVNLAMNTWGVEVLNRIGEQFVNVGRFPVVSPKGRFIETARFVKERNLSLTKEQRRKLSVHAQRLCVQFGVPSRYVNTYMQYPLSVLEQAYEEMKSKF